MPIDLTNLNNLSSAKPILKSAKYFSNGLTGSSTATRGYLNKNRHTLEQVKNDTLLSIDYYETYPDVPFSEGIDTSSGNHHKQVTNTPTSLLQVLKQGSTLSMVIPVKNSILDLNDIVNNRNRYLTEDNNYTYHYHAVISSIQKHDHRDPDFKNANTMRYSYVSQPAVLKVPKDTDIEEILIKTVTSSEKATANQATMFLIWDGQGLSRIMPGLDPYDEIKQLSLSTLLTKQANLFEENAIETALSMMNSIQASNLYAYEKTTLDVLEHMDNKIFDFLQTDDYSNISKIIKKRLDKTEFRHFVESNLRLRLAETLSQIDNNRGNLHQLPKDDVVNQAWNAITKYSKQQKEIILSNEPLIIAQAGAGAGKSTTVVGRLNYLRDLSEDLSKVLVLSFTNAAADVITDRFPEVQSQTLASFVHEIYSHTFPDHQLTNIGTFKNTLSLINITNKVFQSLNIPMDELKAIHNKFKDLINRFYDIQFNFYSKESIARVISDTINFVNEQPDYTFKIADVIKMSTLEMEPILVSYGITTNPSSIVFPDKYKKINYIITDESQDISSFEYNLLLDFIKKYQAQLMIVGDGSQTLYEFRSSDPRYLNTLESSGIFTTYKLTTNYRSKQTILDFANQFLAVIHSNSQANIRLHSNNLGQPTLQDLEDSISLENVVYTKIGRQANQGNDLPEAIKNTFHNNLQFITDGLNKGEQTAILAHSRKEIDSILEVIEQNLPNAVVVDLRPNRSNTQPIWTTAISYAKKDLDIMPMSNHFILNAKTLLEEKAERQGRTSAQKSYFKQLMSDAMMQFIGQYAAHLMSLSLSPTNKRSLIVRHLIQFLTSYESKKLTAESLLKGKEKQDTSTADIIVSTIHSAKGFEFDRTVVLNDMYKYQRSDTKDKQANLRAMFVALSRAKSKELILNFHPNALINNQSMFDDPMTFAYNELNKNYTGVSNP